METEREVVDLCAAAATGKREPVLWSRATAREIVTVIAEDAEIGALAPAEAVELIDRIWQRAGGE